MVEIFEDERVDDLACGLRVIQRPAGFCFGIEALLLADAAHVGAGETLIELGAGSMVALLLLWKRSEARQIVGVEKNAAVVARARRTLALNGISEDPRLMLVEGDIRDCAPLENNGAAHVVIANPPYFPFLQGRAMPKDEERALARCEGEDCKLEHWVATASRLLCENGRALFVYRCDRKKELLSQLSKHDLSATWWQNIENLPAQSTGIFLTEAVKGKPKSCVERPPLLLHDAPGIPSAAWHKLYHEDEITSFTAAKTMG